MDQFCFEHFVTETVNAKGMLEKIEFHVPDNFNFGYDVVDDIAARHPDKRAMVWLSGDQKTEKVFTFADMKYWTDKTANYFSSLGIQKGDRVMLVLKRHYQFWFSIVALHKIGAITIPATNQLLTKDYVYRFNAAGVKAIICTSDDNVPANVEGALEKSPTVTVKCLVGDSRGGWEDFNQGVENASSEWVRQDTQKDELMLMYFTSGTTGYPKIAAHSHTYTIGHLVTARWWHHVDPDGLHFTISDTGWGKSRMG